MEKTDMGRYVNVHVKFNCEWKTFVALQREIGNLPAENRARILALLPTLKMETHHFDHEIFTPFDDVLLEDYEPDFAEEAAIREWEEGSHA